MDSIVPITAGIIVSRINKYILNTDRFNTCCSPASPEEIEPESESDDTTNTEMTESLSRTSAITATTLPTHPIHYPYVHHG